MRPLRILVVDDNRDFADGIAELLAVDGHGTDVAYSGEEALERWRAGPYDLVCMDLVMPGLDGAETLRAMGKGVVAIAMTAYSLQPMREAALAHGARQVLNKPVDPGVLLELVERLGAERQGAEGAAPAPP